MPLLCTEDTAITLAVKKIEANEGDVAGVQNYLRSIGAHSEQARRLAERAVDAYHESLGIQPPQESERHVSVALETSEGELNLTLKADRLPITTLDELVEFYNIDTDVWKPASTLFNFWGSKANPNFQVRARFEKDKYADAVKVDREELREFLAREAPAWKETPPAVVYGERMLEIVLSDLHWGKSVNDAEWKHNLWFAATGLIDQARDYDVALVNIVLLGDTFNSEGRRKTTTNGTMQEEGEDWRQAFTDAREFIADLALHTFKRLGAEVNINVIAGNHDYERSYYLQDSLFAYFHNHPSINVPLSTGIRSYLQWGHVYIGLSHGDMIKASELPLLMLRETTANGSEDLMYWHLGHYHTRKEDEIQGVTVKYFGTPSNVGEWELTKGYGNNRKEIVGIIFDATDGEVATFRSVIK